MYKQDAPFCIQIELVEGCPLRCNFCGLNGIRGKKHDFKFMHTGTLQMIAEAILRQGWNVRIELAMHGEPTKHPEVEKMVYMLRSYLPKAYIMMETNGAGLARNPLDKVVALFEAGLTTLAVDEYQNIKWAQQIREGLGGAAAMPDCNHEPQFIVGPDVDYYEYPAEPNGNPHQRSRRKRLVFIAPIDLAQEGTHARLANHAGSGAPRNDHGMGKRCALPFREMSFRHDGSMAVCCNDWRGVLPIGNIHTHTLQQMWQHPRMQAMRRMLYHGLREAVPCHGCDMISYRTGLLPDKKGKLELPRPTRKDRKLLADGLADGPLTAPVLRPWE